MLYQAHITLSGDGSAAEFGKGVAYGRSRIKQLRALGKSYATENAKFGDVTVRMKLAGQQSFIHVDVAALGGYIVRPTSQVNPNGVTQSTPPTVPPTSLIPQAVISKVSKGDGASLKLKIKEHSNPYGTDSAAHLKTVDWRSTDGKTIIAFAEGDRYGRRDTVKYPWFDTPPLIHVYWFYFLNRPQPDYPFFIRFTPDFYTRGRRVIYETPIAGIAKKGNRYVIADAEDVAIRKIKFYVMNGENYNDRVQIGEFTVPFGESMPSAWHFNGDGTKCVSFAVKNDPASFSSFLLETRFHPQIEQFRMIVASFTFNDDDVSVSCNYSGDWISAIKTNHVAPHAASGALRDESIATYLYPLGADFFEDNQFLLTVETSYIFQEQSTQKTSVSGPFLFAADWRYELSGGYGKWQVENDELIEKRISKIKAYIKYGGNTIVSSIVDFESNNTHSSTTEVIPYKDNYFSEFSKNEKISTFSKNINLDILTIESIDLRNKSFVGTKFVLGGTSSQIVKTNYLTGGIPELISPEAPIAGQIKALLKIKDKEHIENVGAIENADTEIFSRYYHVGIGLFMFGRPFFLRPTSSNNGIGAEVHFGGHNWRKNDALFSLKPSATRMYFVRDSTHALVGDQPYFFTNTSASKDSVVIAALKDAQTGNYTFKDVKDQFAIGGESKFEIRPILVY